MLEYFASCEVTDQTVLYHDPIKISTSISRVKFELIEDDINYLLNSFLEMEKKKEIKAKKYQNAIQKLTKEDIEVLGIENI